MAGDEKLIAENRRARHDYHLTDRVEAGLVLTGSEVKSLRAGGGQLRRSFADIRDGDLWLVGAHIATYEQAGIPNHDPDRDRKLLLHRKEIDSLLGKVQERGFTLVPTKLYFKNGRAKVEIALAKGKDVRDRRVRSRSGTRIGRSTGRCASGPAESDSPRRYNVVDIRGRSGFDVVGSPAELQAEVPGRPRKTTGNKRKCG